MILTRLSEEADAASARYGLLTNSWRSIYLSALNDRDFGTVLVMEKSVDEAYAIASSFIADERQTIERLIEEIATEARRATISELRSIDTSELSERALEHLNVTQSYLVDEIVAQIHRDIALLRQTIQRVSLEVSIAARSRSISERAALIEYQIGNVSDIQFSFHDRSSRKWASSKFIRTVWRHTLLSVYNEIVLYTLADHGLSRARVEHQDPAAEVHNMVIAMGSNSEFPTYSEIRMQVFHPNANAILRSETVHV